MILSDFLANPKCSASLPADLNQAHLTSQQTNCPPDLWHLGSLKALTRQPPPPHTSQYGGYWNKLCGEDVLACKKKILQSSAKCTTCAIFYSMRKVLQSSAKCAQICKICKKNTNCAKSAKMYQMCKLCKIVQNVPNYAKCASRAKRVTWVTRAEQVQVLLLLTLENGITDRLSEWTNLWTCERI